MSLYSEILKDSPFAYWRMSDAVTSETVSRYNICPNPSLEVNATGFSTQRYGSSKNNSNFAGIRVASGGVQGPGFYRATATEAWSFLSWITTPEATVTDGLPYVVSMFVRVNRATQVRVHVETLRSDGSVLALSVGANVSVSANTWTRIAQIASVPDGGRKIRGLAVVESLNSSDAIDVDGVMYEQTTEIGSYFDGSSAGAVWLGTSGSSSSRLDSTLTHRYMIDETGVYRGDYTASGVNLNVAGRPAGGDAASQFSSAGFATVTGGNGSWDLGTVSGRWTIEFLARFDNDTPGTLFSTGRWRISTTGDGKIGYGPADSSAPPIAAVSAPWTDNAWHHYVLTYGAGLLTWYVDGQDIASFPDTGLNAAGSGALQIAGGVSATLDEIAIYGLDLNDGRVSAHWLSVDTAFGEVITSTYLTPMSPVLTLQRNAVVTQQLSVTIQYADGSTSTPAPGTVTWSTTDAAVVSVTSGGLVRALKEGSVGITATMAALGVTATTQVSVLPVQPLIEDGRAVYAADSTMFVYDDDGNLTATTEEFWEVDPGRLMNGEWVYDTPFSLATLAYNISTLAGREGIPQTDGENIRIATRPGRRWVPKTPDQKQLSLAMWVQGTEADGRIPTDVYLRTKFWENYNALKQLFAVYDRQILLRRRMPTRHGIVTMQTWVEPASTMDISPTGPMRGTFSIDLIMSDPFWRAPEQKSDPVRVATSGGQRRYPRSYPLAYGSYGQTGIYTLFNDGTHDARLVVEIHGPVTNPEFLNMDTNERFRLLTDVQIESGDVILVDFYNRTIELQGSGSRYWWLDRTTDWLSARAGYQRLQFSHEGPEEKGYVVWRWEPAYL